MRNITSCGAVIAELVTHGFYGGIIEALRRMTHDKSIPYVEYVREIKKNPIAVKVKRVDLTYNSDLTRLDLVDDGSNASRQV